MPELPANNLSDTSGGNAFLMEGGMSWQQTDAALALRCNDGYVKFYKRERFNRMKKNMSILLSLMLLLTAVLTACGGSNGKENETSNTNTPKPAGNNAETGNKAAETGENEPPAKELSGEITFWTFGSGDMMEKFYASFSKAYPKVKVNTQILRLE